MVCNSFLSLHGIVVEEEPLAKVEYQLIAAPSWLHAFITMNLKLETNKRRDSFYILILRRYDGGGR